MTNYQALTIELVLFIHEKIIQSAGGKQGIRDFSLLHSALERCKATFGGEDLYPSTFDKAAALWHSLTMNHAFLDGNKRTSFAIMSRFLNQNGYIVENSQDEIVRICISIDNDGLELKDIVKWLKEHTKPRECFENQNDNNIIPKSSYTSSRTHSSPNQKSQLEDLR